MRERSRCDQFTIAPEALIGTAHFAISLFTRSARYCGVICAGVEIFAPRPASLPATAGDFIASTAAALSLLTMIQAVAVTGSADHPVQAHVVLVLHGLVADDRSRTVLAEDLAALLDGREPAAQATSLRAWALGLADRAQSPDTLAELPAWRDRSAASDEAWAGGADAAPAGPPVQPHGDGPAAHTTLVPADLTTAVLDRIGSTVRASTDDVLLTALHAAAPTGTSLGSLLVEVGSDGRPPLPGLDPTRLVGHLATAHPRLLDPGTRRGLDALKRAKEARLAARHDGLGHGLLRYANPQTAATLAATPGPPIAFRSTLGRSPTHHPTEAGWPDDAHASDSQPASGVRRSGLTLDVTVAEGRLVAEWTSPDGSHTADDLAAIGERWIDAIRDLAAEADPGRRRWADAVGPHAARPRPGRHRHRRRPLRPPRRGRLAAVAAAGGPLLPRVVRRRRARRLHRHRPLRPRPRPSTSIGCAAVLAGSCGANPTLRAGFVGDGLPRPVQAIARPRRRRRSTSSTSASSTPTPSQTALDDGHCRRTVPPVRPAPAPARCTSPSCGSVPTGAASWCRRHLLLWDGWSGQLVFGELFRRYEPDGDDLGWRRPALRRLPGLAGRAGRRRPIAAAWRDALAGIEEPTLVAPGSGRARRRCCPRPAPSSWTRS